MSFDIGGTTITNDGTNINIGYGGNVLQRYTLGGNLQKYLAGTPMFLVGSSTTTTAVSASSWYVVEFNYVANNYRSCFSTSTNVFTAPTSGMYLFSTSAYTSQAAAGGYIHPMFWINGSPTANRLGSANYRVRGYATKAGGYAVDGDTSELIYLNAGDYCGVRVYFSTDGTFYNMYSFFAGALLG